MIVLHGDCLQILPTLSGLDASITDPPYELAFMGRDWDRSGVAFNPDTWRLVYDALKPGAHLLAFGGSRTFARMFCAIEDAGFEYRDTLMWLYGTGFPKSHDISKAIDKAAGAERLITRHGRKRIGGYGDDWDTNDSGERERRDIPATPEAQQWAGWGTALKPAFEPIGMFRKPLDNCTVAANVLKHGTGAINIDACRVQFASDAEKAERLQWSEKYGRTDYADNNAVLGSGLGQCGALSSKGRWPANCLHDGSDEVEAAFAAFNAPGQQGRARTDGAAQGNNTFGAPKHITTQPEPRGDTGTASRFFYSAKASKADRAGSKHPTIKPLSLMRWLVRLVTPPGGTVLDCFAGSGTTGEAAMLEGFNAVLIEQEPEYVADIQRRLSNTHGPLFAA